MENCLFLKDHQPCLVAFSVKLIPRYCTANRQCFISLLPLDRACPSSKPNLQISAAFHFISRDLFSLPMCHHCLWEPIGGHRSPPWPFFVSLPSHSATSTLSVKKILSSSWKEEGIPSMLQKNAMSGTTPWNCSSVGLQFPLGQHIKPGLLPIFLRFRGNLESHSWKGSMNKNAASHCSKVSVSSSTGNYFHANHGITIIPVSWHTQLYPEILG